MKRKDAAEVCENFLRELSEAIDPKDQIPLFPTTLDAYDTAQGIFLEFRGNIDKLRPLRVNYRRLANADDLFNLFPSREKLRPIFASAGEYRLSGMIFTEEGIDDLAMRRFPTHRLFTGGLRAAGGLQARLSFPYLSEIASIDNVMVCQAHEKVSRAKYFKVVLGLPKSTTKRALRDFLRYSLISIDGNMFHCPLVNRAPAHIDYTLAEFQSIYLSSRENERTIARYLEDHPALLKMSLDADEIIFEPKLKNFSENKALIQDSYIPDALFRAKGEEHFNILDFKLAKPSKTNLVASSSGGRRKRFGSYVRDGIQQLAEYQEYFNDERNADFAESTYGVKIANPKLYLVVGSWENIKHDDANQAMLSEKTNLTILDYDTFCQQIIEFIIEDFGNDIN